jgi:cellulose synthase/poly-beta-1,6-N-acetylglucosamine synthase-like glycosyltransferase
VLSSLVTVTAWISRVVFALYAYDFVVSLAGLLALRRPASAPRTTRFAVLVCAHNEQNVVADVVKSLLQQDYPSDLVRILVVADNCSDATALVARNAGAIVLERADPDHRTKGYALQWGMERALAEYQFDALCVFDADNRVATDFLATMNDYLAAGHVAIQAYLDTKNPTQSWVTRCIALGYFVTNRFWMRARARIGLSATLGGTGFCLAYPIAAQYRWHPGSLADDLELTMKLIRDGVRVSYCYHTRSYDEKPVTLRQSFRQRARWMQGHNDVALRWVLTMLWGAVRKGSIRRFDAALHLLQPLRLLVAFSSLVVLLSAAAWAPSAFAGSARLWLSPFVWLLPAALFVVYPLIIAATERTLPFAIRNLVPFMLFAFTWIPAIVLGLLRIRRRVWIHTAHGMGAPASSLLPPRLSHPTAPSTRQQSAAPKPPSTTRP